MKNIFIFLTFFIIVSFFIWQGIYLPKEKLGENKIFSIESGQNLFQVATNLEREDLIKNKFFFEFYVILKRGQKKLRAGKYELSSSMTIPEIAKKFIQGETAKIKITIPEGFTLKQIEEELSSNLTRTFLVKLKIRNFQNEFNFLEDIPEETSLEGFLFPDTYFFEFDEGDEEMIRKFLTNFDKKLIPNLREEIKNQKKTIFEIIIMASLLEKEVKTKEDKEIVSGILWKRLKVGMPLQVDATISYITGKKTTEISINETKIDSPYNTYKYRGLPAGPICNPGLESIEAALYPKESQYWYYLSIPDGKTIFSKTLEEHNIAKAKYLR